MTDIHNLDDDKPFSLDLITDVHWMKHGLETYVTLAGEVEDMLDIKERNLLARMEANDSALSSEHQVIVAETLSLELRDYEDTFRFLQREAVFLTLYNYFEHLLGEAATRIGQELGSRVRLADIHGRGIERALLFLDRVAHFEFNAAGGELALIRGANQLRNVIVHAGRVLPQSPKEPVNKFVVSHPHLYGEPGAQVLLQRSFVFSIAETFGKFIGLLEQEMQQCMDRLWRRPAAPAGGSSPSDDAPGGGATVKNDLP
jgi:hypothetical protein